jgi:hypothetical protein
MIQVNNNRQQAESKHGFNEFSSRKIHYLSFIKRCLVKSQKKSHYFLIEFEKLCFFYKTKIIFNSENFPYINSMDRE